VGVGVEETHDDIGWCTAEAGEVEWAGVVAESSDGEGFLLGVGGLMGAGGDEGGDLLSLLLLMLVVLMLLVLLVLLVVIVLLLLLLLLFVAFFLFLLLLLMLMHIIRMGATSFQYSRPVTCCDEFKKTSRGYLLGLRRCLCYVRHLIQQSDP